MFLCVNILHLLIIYKKRFGLRFYKNACPAAVAVVVATKNLQRIYPDLEEDEETQKKWEMFQAQRGGEL